MGERSDVLPVIERNIEVLKLCQCHERKLRLFEQHFRQTLRTDLLGHPACPTTRLKHIPREISRLFEPAVVEGFSRE